MPEESKSWILCINWGSSEFSDFPSANSVLVSRLARFMAVKSSFSVVLISSVSRWLRRSSEFLVVGNIWVRSARCLVILY